MIFPAINFHMFFFVPPASHGPSSLCSLVGGLEHEFYFPYFSIIYGMSYFPLTNSIIFQDGYCTTKQFIYVHWHVPFPRRPGPWCQVMVLMLRSRKPQHGTGGAGGLSCNMRQTVYMCWLFTIYFNYLYTSSIFNGSVNSIFMYPIKFI